MTGNRQPRRRRWPYVVVLVVLAVVVSLVVLKGDDCWPDPEPEPIPVDVDTPPIADEAGQAGP